MRDLDLSEYSYKNGYEKGYNEGYADGREKVLAKVAGYAEERARQIPTHNDDFSWGMKRAFEEVALLMHRTLKGENNGENKTTNETEDVQADVPTVEKQA